VTASDSKEVLGTSVTLRETTIEDTRSSENGEGGYGIQVSGGASLDAETCEVRGNTAMGVIMDHSGTSVTLRETAIEDTQPRENGASGYGIGVAGGANLDMEACEVRRNTSVGVLALGSGTTATLRDTKITSTKRGEVYTVGTGLCAQDSASVVAAGIEVSSNEGPGFYVVEVDTQLTCSDCVVQNNQFSGMIVVADASLQLAESLIEGTTEQENLGGGSGIFAEPWLGGPPTLSVTGTTIQRNAIAGVWLSGQGSYSFSDNTIHGGEGWTRESLCKCGDAVYAREGVMAWDGSSGLLLENNELLNGRGAGLLLDNASATLSGNSYADNAVDLVTQGADCATPPVGYDDEAIGSAELCPAYDYAACRDEFTLRLTLGELQSGYGAALTGPPLGANTPHLPATPVALPHAFEPLLLLPPAQRVEPREPRPHPLRHERRPPLPPVVPWTH